MISCIYLYAAILEGMQWQSRQIAHTQGEMLDSFVGPVISLPTQYIVKEYI